ncbi:MAG: hypothetical protein LBU56_02860 [Rickettsiales bacterium]|jgi:hypothetical protein|nr:hypothetical protein [Rickettsiales bacterium]
MSVYQYFKRYIEYGIVPAKKIEDFTLAPESSFYKSVHYIDNVLGPVKDIICGVESEDDHNVSVQWSGRKRLNKQNC